MGCHVYLFRSEVREHYPGPDFFENEDLITPFTGQQFEKLKGKLLRYGYQVESSREGRISFNYKGGLLGISVLLTTNQLCFTAGSDEEGVFEIFQTASELAGTGEFARFDPQEGSWEEF